MSLLSSFGAVVSSALNKAVQFGENVYENLVDDEIIVANGAVTLINAIETVMDAAKTTVSTIPTVGTAGAAVISEAEDILNNLKSVAEAIATAAAQQPGGETKV